jgi:hypothetical protein
MSNLLECYIHSLINNINKPINKENAHYNLVIDGGAFNCAFSGGCLYYIKELEKLNYIRVNKVSGCSIGAILGYMYLTNTLNLLPVYYDCLLAYGRKNINFNIIKKLIKNHVKKTDYRVINKKLFITFNNITTLKHHVVSEYTSEKHLIKCLIKTCFIPYMIDGKIGYKDKKYLYCDGFSPYIFKNDGHNTIFISLITMKLFKHSFYTCKDKYIWDKLFCGIKDVHLFFTANMKKTKYCSLVNKWNYNMFIGFTLRELFNKLILGLVLNNLACNTNVLNILLYLKNNIYFKEFIGLFKLFLNNIISYKIL